MGTAAASAVRGFPLPASAADLSPVRNRAVGWLLYLWLLIALAKLLPPTVFTPGHAQFIFLIGLVGLWRYSNVLAHFVRAMIFLHVAFPAARRAATQLGAAAMPSHVYFLVTSFRIDAHTSAAVYRSVIEEAARCPCPATVVASLVEYGDESLLRMLWERLAPARIKLKIIRIPGTGKRDGLAQAFRAIARDVPDERAVVAVIDGDTVLRPGLIRQTAPFLELFPKVGALTTNEFCQVQGSWIMSEWHKLRFAQRHIHMCSMALSKRVLTLTGRMSLFRARLVTDPEFINDVEDDHLDHWRLGRFKFLTGDDKSSWFSLARRGYETYYVPDAAIDTMEHPPDRSFFVSSRMLMFRWYGNALRQNTRALRLGPARLGLFPYYVLFDQRISMWTSLFGLCAALVASLKYGATVLVVYALWIGLSRLFLTALLVPSGHPISPWYPVLLYYNQIVGALMKIHVFFHLDQQSWTRQKTVLARQLTGEQRRLYTWSSHAMTFFAASLFAAVVVSVV